MAQNEVRDIDDLATLPVPVGYTSGDPVVVGRIPGVLQTDRDAAGNASVKSRGRFDLSVKGVNDAGNAAIAVGDALFWVEADTPDLSAKASGAFFGYAMEAVDSGATATIEVRVADAGDSRTAGVVPLLSVGTGEIADDAVTAAKVADAAIDAAAKIVNGVVTKSKLAGGFLKMQIVAGQDETGDNTITLTGIAVGDELVFFAVMASTASVATITQRALTDFTISADTLTVGANAANNAANSYLVAYLDLT